MRAPNRRDRRSRCAECRRSNSASSRSQAYHAAIRHLAIICRSVPSPKFDAKSGHSFAIRRIAPASPIFPLNLTRGFLNAFQCPLMAISGHLPIPPATSAFGDKADIKHRVAERPLIVRSGHWSARARSSETSILLQRPIRASVARSILRALSTLEWFDCGGSKLSDME